MIRLPLVRRPRARHETPADSWWSRHAWPIAVVLGVLATIAAVLYAIEDNSARNRQQDEIRRSQKCQQDLNTLNAERNLALTNIQTDDRHAVDQWIARVNLDIQERRFNDLPAAYEAYREERLANDRQRAKYGAGIKVKGSACNFKIVPVSHSPLPSASVTPRRSPTPVLPSLPHQQTVTQTGPSGTHTVVIQRQPGETRTVVHTVHDFRTKTITTTVTASPSCLVLHIVC